MQKPDEEGKHQVLRLLPVSDLGVREMTRKPPI
jgi:hypothetical protein